MSPRSAAINELPISVKGVVANDAGEYLLGKNSRNEWELLGGRIESGEDPLDTLRREFNEEAGIEVDVWPRPLGACVFDVLEPQGQFVFIVAFGCEPASPTVKVRKSHEHRELRWFDVAEAVALPNLPDGYKQMIRVFKDARRPIPHIDR